MFILNIIIMANHDDASRDLDVSYNLWCLILPHSLFFILTGASVCSGSPCPSGSYGDSGKASLNPPEASKILLQMHSILVYL